MRSMELVVNGGTYANLLPGQLSYRVVHFFYGYIVNYWEDRLPSDLYGRVRYVDDSFMAHDNDGVLLHLFSPLFLRRYYEERQGLNEDEPDAVTK